MRDLRRRNLDNSVWIPLRASTGEGTGRYGYLGHRSEFFGLGSLAVPVERRDQAEMLGWTDIGLARSHVSYLIDGRYVPADVFDEHELGLGGVPLVLAQDGNSEEHPQWHLHQDLVIALRLKREGEVWVAINEGYVEVARLLQQPDGEPTRLEVRAEYLKDYLCARGMALYVSWYRDRREVVSDARHITWHDNPLREVGEHDRWEGRLIEIHEGGHPFGASAAVVHGGRENVDYDEDVPNIGPLDGNIVSKSWKVKWDSPKLTLVRGELWRNEWVNPGAHSPRVRDDKISPTAFFIVNAEGSLASQDSLQDSGQWLWFNPDVMMALAHRRGSRLDWYTRDTGRVWCTPSGIDFGANKLGLVNVYAKDIAFLPTWQQRIWAGFSLTPEGGVSNELLAAQASGTPVNTQAPEQFLAKGIELLNEVAAGKLGFRLFREHEHFKTLLARTHRFRAVDQAGFFSLAKDVARLTADSIDTRALQRKAPPPQGEKWGSLKTLEHVLANHSDAARAFSVLGPLHGVYNLRQADAHLPGADLTEAYRLVHIDPSAPFVMQGYQLLRSCVTALYEIVSILQGRTSEKTRG